MTIAINMPAMPHALMSSGLLVDDVLLPEQMLLSSAKATPERTLVFAVVLQAFEDARRDRDDAREWWRRGNIGRVTANDACAFLGFERDALVSAMEKAWAKTPGAVPYLKLRQVTRGRDLSVGKGHNRNKGRRSAA